MKLERAILGVVAAIAVVQAVAIYRGRRALWEAHVATANAKAEGDRTRTRLAGQLRIAARFMYQGQVDLDGALRAKGQTDHALVRIRVERDSLAALVPVAIVMPVDQPVELDAQLDARDSLGVFVRARTTLEGFAPVRPDPVAWTRFDVVREPLQLDVALSCQGHDALAQVAGPRWATLELRNVKQRPEICNPRPAAWQPFSFELPSLPWTAGLLLGGIVIGVVVAH